MTDRCKFTCIRDGVVQKMLCASTTGLLLRAPAGAPRGCRRPNPVVNGKGNGDAGGQTPLSPLTPPASPSYIPLPPSSKSVSPPPPPKALLQRVTGDSPTHFASESPLPPARMHHNRHPRDSELPEKMIKSNSLIKFLLLYYI